MTKLDTRQLLRVFRKLDMQISDARHHLRATLTVNGQVVLMAYASHGRSELPGMVTERLRKQFRLTPAEFDRLVSCEMTRDEYLSILVPRLEPK